MKSSLRVGALVSLSLLLPAALSAQKQTRMVFVSAVDGAGAPVPNLATTDFDVREGDAKRTVTFAAPANVPMRIMLLLDTSGTAEPFLQYVQAGLAAFVDAIPEPHEIGIISTGRQARVRLAPTADRAKVKNSLKSYGSDGGGIAFFDGLQEAESRFQKKEGVRWPVYVILATDAPEASTANLQNAEFNRMTSDMMTRGTTVHAAVIQKAGPTIATDVAIMLAKNTGGYTDVALSGLALADKLKAVAARIVSDHQSMAARYQVEYVSDARYSGPVDVGVTRDGVRSKISLRRPF